MPDPTVGQDFVLRVWPRGAEEDIEYHLKFINTGWDFRHEEGGGSCDKAGRPFLTYRLAYDHAGDPLLVADRLQRLWRRARRGGLSPAQVQAALDELSEWLRVVNEHAPRGPVWEEAR